MYEAAVTKQLAELQLIRCSLLPNETMQFIDDANESLWGRLLDGYEKTMTFKSGELPAPQIPPAKFRVKADRLVKVWFEVEMPLQDGDGAVVHVKGDYLSRTEQERWQNVIHEKQRDSEVEGAEYPTYELLFLHLLPLLQAQSTEGVDPGEQGEVNKTSFDSKQIKTSIYYHALLTSHHLVSPHKRRSLQEWSSSFGLSGFAKVGYPGVIYAQGEQGCVEEFVASVKSMQWLALRVRFVEPVGEMDSGVDSTEQGLGRSWKEFQKVGDVVDEMKRLGREKYVIEMGIGSARAK